MKRIALLTFLLIQMCLLGAKEHYVIQHYSINTGRVVVSAQGEDVVVSVPQAGLYIVKIGSNLSRKVLVMK